MKPALGLSDALRSAAGDYLFLLDRGYPDTASVKIVGDRYRLSKEERGMLFRGLASTEKARARRRKLTERPTSKELHVDGYNVLFTLLNYRQGKRLFISSDGFLRDTGGVHGRFTDRSLFYDLARELLAFLPGRGFSAVTVYLDSPVSHSAEHAGFIRELISLEGLSGTCELCASADYCLKAARPSCAVTSDTAVIDALSCGVYDLARTFLKERYGAEFLRFDLGISRAEE
jgi:hypothetical protein